MKKILTLTILALLGITSCSKNEGPKEPVDQRALLVGTWASQRTIQVLTVNGKSGEAFDTLTPGTTMEFTEDFNYYGHIDSTAIIASVETEDLADTGRYNLENDSIFLIRSALAFDTLVVKKLDESELQIVIDAFVMSISGQLVTQETVMSFQRLSATKPEDE